LLAYRILVINPGSTTTKVAVYSGSEPEFIETIHHDPAQLSTFSDILEQREFRKRTIVDLLHSKGLSISGFHVVVSRGGLCKPIPSGVYEVNQQMIEDLRTSVLGKHASSLGGIIAHELASEAGVRALIVDPVVVDEMEPLARYSGWSLIPRKSIFHALNQKAAARTIAARFGVRYEELNMIVVHLGGGISVGVHRRGRVVDVNNGMEEGPFAPERAGSLPIGDLIRICFSGKYTKEQMLKVMSGQGGLVSYLGTNDGREVERRIETGDTRAAEVYEAMAYQVAKEIGAGATVLAGDVDAIVLTGGLARSRRFVASVKSRVRFIAPVFVVPGDLEMETLAKSALQALTGEVEIRTYAPVGDWHHYQGFC